MPHMSTVIVLASCLPFLLGLCYLTLKLRTSQRGLTLPDVTRVRYLFSYLHHGSRFLLNSEQHIRHLWSRVEVGSLMLRFLSRSIYLAITEDQIRWLFKSSKPIQPTQSLLEALSSLFGLPAEDQKFFYKAHAPSTDKTAISTEIMASQRKDFARYFHGESLSRIMIRFKTNLHQEMLLSTNDPDIWVDKPDLFAYIAGIVFRAEVEAIYGKQIFKLCPSLTKDFWRFYDSFPVITNGVPRWIYPWPYSHRQKINNHLHTWRIWCQTNACFDTEVEYDHTRGTEYVRKMTERFEQLGLSDGGIAATLAGFMFVTVSNSIPATIWMVLYILRDNSLYLEICDETNSAFEGAFLDIETLCRLPLLNSVYFETLRLHIAGTAGGVPSSEVRLCNQWPIRPEIPVVSADWVAALDAHFWNWKTGTQVPDRTTRLPIEEFWARRFLQGHWFPFGGGASKCPGETLAKHTILSSVAMIMRHLKIQLLKPEDAASVKASHRTLPFGSHAFDRKVPVKVQRMRQNSDIS